uniref:LysM domain-containing protein n=1 Tax=Plectus sambesii TaxID=2011161 RepID=A0A914UNE8_9BILA
MDYEINTWDTLERIAASHDCTVGELMKLNRMASRIVFPGMKIRVPFPTDDVFDSAQNNRHNTAQKRTSIASENADDGIRKGPGSAVPSVHSMPAKDDRSRTTTVDSAELDAECLQRFLKVKVKQLTETDGTVGGVLLVTPNCLMFDPDVTHALVREKGSDLYGMVANMDDIMAVALYKDIGALTGEKSHQNDVYDPDRVAPQDPASGTTSEEVLPLIVEEELANVGEKPSDTTVQRRHNSDLTSDNAVYGLDDSAFFPEDGLESGSCPSLGRAERPRAQSDLLGSSNANGSNEQQKASRISPRSARRSVLRLGRTLSSRAYSFGGTVASGAQSVAQTAVSSTKNAAHGVVTHTKSAADTLQTGAKAAAGAVASVPQNIVNMSSGLFAPESVGTASGILDVRDTWFAYNEDMQNSPTTMKRQQSLATLETLRLKTQQARDEANSKQNKL